METRCTSHGGMKHLRLVCFLLILFTFVFTLSINIASADSYDTLVNNFINDSRWKHMASWGSNAVPQSSRKTGWTCYSCFAYCQDFFTEVWDTQGKSTFRYAGESFTDPNQIRDGDIIYTESGGVAHYYAVLKRNSDGTLKTAEGNLLLNSATNQRVAWICSDRYSVSNPGRDKSFINGWHMPGSASYDTEKPKLSNVSVSNIDSTGYTVSCTVSDNIGVTYVKFPTWTVQNGQDDLLWGNDVIVNSGANVSKTVSYRVNTSAHNNETDCEYVTHIYVYDAAGNGTATNQDINPVLLVHVPAPSYKLTVRGNLDGVEDSSTSGYGTFDVYINGSLDASACTSYSKSWPTGTTYEIRNVQPQASRSYDASVSSGLTGTIGTKESTAILYFTTDGTATTEWQTGKAVPGNLDPTMLDIQYKHTYTQKARTSPGSDWTLIETGAVQYENDGSPYESDYEQSTSATRVLVGYYYFHWCNNGSNANYYWKDYLPYKHTISMADLPNFSVEEKGTDGDGSGRKYYYLKHLNGEWAGNYAQCSSSGSPVYYQGYVYQNRKAYQINTYRMTGDWTDTLDTTADSYTVRWRLKGGVPPEEPDEYTFTIDGWVDGTKATDITDYGFFDLYIDGELYAADITGFSGTFAWNAHYDIQNIRPSVGKKYDGLYYGNISGDFGYGTATVTLSFSTVLDISEDWLEIDSLPQGLDLTGCEIEYKNHYVYSGRTSPGDEWTLYEVGPTQYENDGGTYESDNELTTSATRVLVGNYYFHYCNNGSNANYYWKDYLPYKHTIPMDQLQYFSVEEKGTDGDGSGRKYYYLKNLTGEWAGSYAQCSSTGAMVYYRGYVYQNKKAYTINTYVRESDWTTTPDSSATSVTYRIRLKEYVVTFDANGGSYDIDTLIKSHDVPLTLPEYVPTQSGFIFTGWTLDQAGTGTVYQPGHWFIENGNVTLYAQWTPMSSMTLPTSLKTIGSEAFANCGAVVIYIPNGCTTIESNAFVDNDQLLEIHIPESVTSIDFEAFNNCPQLTIYAPENSRAARLAQTLGIPFVAE